MTEFIATLITTYTPHGFPEEVLPVLLVRDCGLQHGYVHRSMAFDLGLWPRLPLL
jgi:hypothetical protein